MSHTHSEIIIIPRGTPAAIDSALTLVTPVVVVDGGGASPAAGQALFTVDGQHKLWSLNTVVIGCLKTLSRDAGHFTSIRTGWSVSLHQRLCADVASVAHNPKVSPGCFVSFAFKLWLDGWNLAAL